MEDRRIELMADLDEDSPIEEMRVPLHIRGEKEQIPPGLYRWQLNRQGSFLAPQSGPETGEGDEMKPEILVSSEALSLTRQELLDWLGGRRKLEDINPPGGIPYWCRYVRTEGGGENG